MGFFSDLFGGSDDSAQDAQIEANRAAQKFIEKQTAQARGDVFGLFPGAQQARQEGFQGALDVFGQSIPQQFGTFQGGNVAAQQQLLAGQPQIINAILGKPIDMSALQPRRINVDTSFAQQTAPQLQPQQQQQSPGFDIESLLASLRGIQR